MCREMHRYNLKILGLCETRWNGSGRTRLTSGDTIIYSGQEEGQPHMYEQLWATTNQTPMETEIKKRKWSWIGHTLRKPETNITRQALDWNPQGKRKVGRPKQTWRRSIEAETKSTGMSWAELKRTSQNRVRWRSVVAALCSSRNPEA